MSALNRSVMLAALYERLDDVYLLGAKWDLQDEFPAGPIDCSGFVRWGYSRGGVLIPDGSYNQYAECDMCPDPEPGDLGFFEDENGTIDHVGVIFDDVNMIEARGAPFGKVILRPRAKWEAWPRFTGYMRLRGL